MMNEEELNSKVKPEAEQPQADVEPEGEAQGAEAGETSDAPDEATGDGCDGGADPEVAEPTGDGPKPDEPKASQEPDWKDMYARTLADFDNYRKRASREREEYVKFAASETVKDMISTADNLALALDQAKDKEDPFVKGVRLAYEGFLKALKDHGAEPFESIGETLDPNRHEAIATLPSDTFEEGRISTEVKKGWMLNGRLLRAAQVVVSSGKGA